MTYLSESSKKFVSHSLDTLALQFAPTAEEQIG